jgi:integrase/recombinase XerD
MNTTLARSPNSKVLTATGNPILPAIIADAGEHAARRFIEFFTAAIRNVNTRRAYAKAVADFLAYCLHSGLTLPGIEPVHVAAYIEQLTRSKAAPTVKQHLAAIAMLFDWLTSGGILPFNPAASVRGPKYSVKRGKTPVLTAKEARDLLDSIDRRDGLQLRPRQCRYRHAGSRLLCRRPQSMVPAL